MTDDTDKPGTDDEKSEAVDQLAELARRVKAGDVPTKDPHPFRQEARTRPEARERSAAYLDLRAKGGYPGYTSQLLFRGHKDLSDFALEDDGTPPPMGIDPRDVESSPEHFRYDLENTIDPKKVLPSHFRVDVDEDGNPHHHPDKIAAVAQRLRKSKDHHKLTPEAVAAAKCRPMRSRGT